MARKPAALALVVACATLALAGSAIAGNAGFGPPPPATPSGHSIQTVYWVIFGICAVVFVGVETTLLLFVFRYRRRRHVPETAEGPQIHGNTRLEIFWTLVPALVLVGIAFFVFAKTPAVRASGAAESAGAMRVRVESHQFYWEYRYPNGAISVDTLRLPVDRPVRLELVSFDVNHSWWVPELTGKLDAIPGRTNVLRFTPMRTGTFTGYCAELCGIQHAVMRTDVEVMSQDAFDSWVTTRGRSTAELGRETLDGVCAKCHGFEGEGDIGPPIAGNSTLVNKQALTMLLDEGQNLPSFPSYMPAVGLGWPERQVDALIEYVKSNPTLSGGTASGG